MRTFLLALFTLSMISGTAFAKKNCTDESKEKLDE